MSDSDLLYPHTAGTTTSLNYGMLGHLLRSGGTTGFSSASTAEEVTKNWDGTGKVAIVTGASSGLGAESTRVLASKGCEVILAVRDVTKGKAVVKEILSKVPHAKLHVMTLDLSSLQSVRDFAAAFKNTLKPLHILLENAGIMAPPFKKSVDGYESQFASNHLGHFLLTQLLLDDLISTAKKDQTEGRIVCVSSLAHMFPYTEGLRVVGWKSDIGYNPFAAYGQSKLCNVLFARELNERLKGEPVVAVSCHPGSIKTNLDHSIEFVSSFVKNIVFSAFSVFMKSIPQGAATQVLLATARDVKGGEYYTDCNVFPTHPLGVSRPLGRLLWELSEQAIQKSTK